MPTIKYTRESIAELEQEREQYKQQRDELIEDIQAQRDLLKEFSKFIDYKLYIHPGNCTYLSYRNELDQLGICKEMSEMNNTVTIDLDVYNELYAKAEAFNKISDVIKKAEFYDRDTALEVIEIVDDLEDK